MDKQKAAEAAAKEHSEYLMELRTEFGQIDPGLTITNKLLQTEIDRVIKGGDGTKPIEIHREKPIKLSAKLLIPVKEFPKVNFVGKLIGPGGANMKRLQHELGIRLAVYGRGSMRDKTKEEEFRKEGGKKYGHLNDDLHVYLEIQAPADQAYEMMGRAIATIKPYFDPNFDDGTGMGAPPPAEADPYSNGVGRGRGRGAPLLAPAAGGRGVPPAPRGAPRAAPRVAPRAAAPERSYDDDYYGAPAAAPARSAYARYEAEPTYEQEAYSRPAAAARDPYASRQASEVQSFDYGHGSSESYGAQDTWEHRDQYSRPSRGGGRSAATADHRAHPYERPAPRHATARY